MPRRSEYLSQIVDRDVRENWAREQEVIRCSIQESDDITWEIAPRNGDNSSKIVGNDPTADVAPLRFIGGVDISFTKNSNQNACASLVILSWPTLDVVYEVHRCVVMEQPYIPGFLAFREVDHIVPLVEQLRRDRPDLEPDVVFVDGNGILHPRRAGLASHLGVICNLRTIGVGKTFLNVDGLTKESVRRMSDRLPIEANGEFNLIGISGSIWGCSLCFNQTIKNPIFVSIGHRVSLSTAVALARSCSLYRVPEPVRQADIISRTVVREWNTDATS